MNIKLSKGARIRINGRAYTGRNVEIINGAIVIDGVAHDDELPGEIHIQIDGDVERVETGPGSVTAQNVGAIQTLSGDVNCGDVTGSIRTMSGDVVCKKVAGNVNTMSGDIRVQGER